MLTFQEKILFLEDLLNASEENYADSFKFEICCFIDEFDAKNKRLLFLQHLHTNSEIENWINKLTSRIVMKMDSIGVDEIIHDYFELG
jgi:hypothetical protein